VSRALQIVTLCCCVASQASCYSPEITACEVTCAEAGGNCPEGTACTGGYCNPPGVAASVCRAGGVDGGPDFVVPSGMVLIADNGPFSMGCVPGDTLCFDDPTSDQGETPSHLVTVSPYVIDIAEVTVGQYAACVDDSACIEPSTDVTTHYDPNANPNWPVTGMSRASAEVYCRWLDKRLPTEAEWEKAARGASTARIYPWGDDPPGCNIKAHFKASNACVQATPADVKSFEDGQSFYGLYDMSGNVWEWVSDWSAPYPMSAVVDPEGPESGSTGILRGGGWRTGEVQYMRVSNRNTQTITVSSNTYGMRCAKGVL